MTASDALPSQLVEAEMCVDWTFNPLLNVLGLQITQIVKHKYLATMLGMV
jgi:hypothetical protein